MRRTFRTREFAAIAGVTTKALHHYDRVGLLKPHRTHAGYRAYTDHDLLRLQQIVALKLIGLSLTRIRHVLDGGVLPLREALRAQRAALQERRDQIDRALAALEHAQAHAGSVGEDESTILAGLITVLAMNNVDALRKYFTDDAWARWRVRHSTWPSPEWVRLYREAEAALGEDLAGARAQELARRAVALFEADTAGDPAVRTALRKASVNREDMRRLLQTAMPDVDVERVSRFLANAAWATWQGPDGRTHETPHVRPHATESSVALLHEFIGVLDEDPAGQRVQQLLARWHEHLDVLSGGDPDTRADMDRAGARWRHWPDGMRRWVASTYDMEVDTWERVMALIESARHAA